MDKTATSSLVQDNGEIGNNATSAPTKGMTRETRSSYKRTAESGRKGCEVVASKRYPLRSAHSSARVLRSTSKKNKAPIEPVNANTAVQPSAKRSQVSASKRNLVRSAHSSARVLRSTSKKKNKAPSEPVKDITAAQPAARKRKRGRPSKGVSPKNDCFKIRQRVRYILNRMNYEQSLIQAYASEGWKGQSLEKIRPEKELERAKAEILRCKFRIREAFRNMDSLLSEGKLEESLFDSEGEISSEDIFCAICGSKHVTLKNDIILCDGVCDRGFHQKCLSPPLLTEDIPLGDEGWLCPACDCKIDCIDVLNELQGSTLSIHDSWEKVFPEAASLSNDSKQIDASELPSDDSEDNDYDPALAEGHMVDENRSSAEDGVDGSDSDYSNFITSSEDSEPSKNKRSESSKNKKMLDDLGLPSEDSEDDDFDPAGPDSSEDQRDKSNSDESDFTSDSDDFCGKIAKSCGLDEVSAPSLSDVRTVDHADRMEISAVDNHPSAEDSSHAFMETELEQGMVLPVSNRRQVERLDYKRLYDEAYGKQSSDSSDEEEWSENSTPSKGNLEDSETDSLAGSLQPAKRCSRRAQAGHQNNEQTPQSERLCGSVSEWHTVLCSNGSSSTARKGHFGPIIKQKLQVHFKKDQYPSRATKESLAQELGLTFNQVSKWFSSTRHYSRVAAAKKERHPKNYTAENNDKTAADSIQPRGSNDIVMENPTVNRNEKVTEERMAQNNLDEGKKEDTPFKQDISCEQTATVAPTVLNFSTNSREVGSPKVVSGENQHSGSSRNVGTPNGGSAEKIPGLDLVDEARKKAILRELRKRKAGR